MSNIFLLLSYLLHSKNNFDKCLVPHKSPIPWIYDGTHRFVTTGTSSVLLKMQATKKQAFPTKNPVNLKNINSFADPSSRSCVQLFDNVRINLIQIIEHHCDNRTNIHNNRYPDIHCCDIILCSC